MPQPRELPDNPIYAFTPSYEHDEQVQQIRIVFQDVPGYIPTAMVCLTVQDAENMCDKLNRRLGLDRGRLDRTRRAIQDHPAPPRRPALTPVQSQSPPYARSDHRSPSAPRRTESKRTPAYA